MRRSSGLLSALILVGVAVGGCSQPINPPISVTSESTAPTVSTIPPTLPGKTVTPTAEPTTSPSPSDTSDQGTSWVTFTTADGELAFDLPSAWSVRDPAGELPEGGGAFAEVTNGAGKPLATLRTNMATGSTCMEKYPYEVLESEQLPALARNGAAPRFVFETRGDESAPGPADTPAAAYGITSVPEPTGDSACAIFHFFTWPPTAAMFGAFYNPDNNVTPGAESLPYLAQARQYMDTAEYQDIRQMITSLRPAR